MKLNMRVEVPQRLKKFLANPTPVIKDIRNQADKTALIFLRDSIREAAPRKKGELAASVEVDLGKKNVFSALAYARAVELGHYASPKYTPKRMFLKFTSLGRDVFIKFVRTKKQPFFFPTLSKNRLKVIDIYEKAFARMLEKL